MTRTISAAVVLLLLVACPPPSEPSQREPMTDAEIPSPGRRAFALNTDMGCAEYNCDLGIKALVFEVVYDPPLATPADEVAP